MQAGFGVPTLVDTSIWIEHLRKSNSLLAGFLDEGAVLVHPFVRGELALGSMKNRAEILSFLDALPNADIASDDEVRQLIETKQLWGSGVGWVDCHLVASALLTQGCAFWTRDAPLRAVAQKAGATLFHGAV